MDQYWGTNLRRWLKLPETVSILERLSPPDHENTAVGPRFFESMHVDGILYPNPFSPIPEIISTGWQERRFIEMCLDENDQVWVALHSGSRGIGNKLATKHIKVAQKLMEQESIPLKDRDLAYLTENSPEFNAYITDLLWAQEFARLNREEMMDRVLKELSYKFYGEDRHQSEIETERINCHHNFTQQEQHFGQKVWITRKGAIQMKKDQKGIIPGSMGTRSYIVSGLENPFSFNSAPHGAGRRFSRSEAKRRFTMNDLEDAMGDISFRHSKSLIDEIPMAYKDIDEVMENSKELVQVDHTLKQIINIKGD
jgi:tRNA-splicing ligase RtcB